MVAYRTVNRVGAATGIVPLLLVWQGLMQAALLITGFVLPPLPLRPLYPVPAAVVDGWCWLVRRAPPLAWQDAVAGLPFARIFASLVYGGIGDRGGVFRPIEVLLLTMLLAGECSPPERGSVGAWVVLHK